MKTFGNAKKLTVIAWSLILFLTASAAVIYAENEVITLKPGWVGVKYHQKIDSCCDKDGWIIKAGEKLPDGLVLSTDGYLSGMPKKAKKHEFEVFNPCTNGNVKISVEFKPPIQPGNNKREIEVVINEKNWEVTKIREGCIDYTHPDDIEMKLGQKFEKGTTISFLLVCTCTSEHNFLYEVKKTAVTMESVPVYIGAQPARKQAISALKPIKLGKTTLSQSGKIYNIKITDKIKGSVIFERDFETYVRYYLGSHLGFLIPFRSTTSYGLLYKGLDDTQPTITEDKSTDFRMLFFGSIYPFGFEPERLISSKSYKRIYLALGTELSANVFKKFYFGIGYEFTYFSISLFSCWEKIGKLQDGFNVGDNINPKNAAVPLDYKSQIKFGIVVGLPLDIATNWLGKIFTISK